MSRSIATRTGDDGTTALLYGQRVPKDHPQIETIGNLDELNTVLGLAKVHCPVAEGRAELRARQAEVRAASRFGIPALAHEECLTGITTLGDTVYPAAIAGGGTWRP